MAIKIKKTDKMKNRTSLFCTLRAWHALLWLAVLTVSCPAVAKKVIFMPQFSAQAQFAGYYAALEQGYYKEAGLDVVIKHPAKSCPVMEYVREGECDFFTAEAITAVLNSGVLCPELVNILQTIQHNSLVLLAKDENIKSLQELKGKRIGAWKAGFCELPFMIDYIESSNVEWVYYVNAVNIYVSGVVDAILLKSYNEKIQMDMSGAKYGSTVYFRDRGYDMPEDGLYTTAEYYKQNPKICQAFAEASRRGWEWVRKNRAKALDIVMKHVKANNVTTSRYLQKFMLEEILRLQEDEEGKAPSYMLKKENYEWVSNLLYRYGYIEKQTPYNDFVKIKKK